MKVALLQLNTTIGDLEGNIAKIVAAVKLAKDDNVDLCISSELALLGYPPKDFLLNRAFIKQSSAAVEDLAGFLKNYPPLLVGTAVVNKSNVGKPLYNAAVFLHKGKIENMFYKSLLPTYDVFDEERYFERSNSLNILNLQGAKIGVTICEDIWNDKDFWQRKRYHHDPILQLVSSGVEYIVNLSASPFTVDKQKIRETMLGSIAKKYKVPIIYVNQVGGNDDLVFDGRSCVFDKDGELIAKAKPFSEDILIIDTSVDDNRITEDDFTLEKEAWNALVLGTRDYVIKCGFQKVLLGLSGGIDSSLVATIAVSALNKENVLGVILPSIYTRSASITDAQQLAKNLGIKTLTIPINDIVNSFDKALRNAFVGYPKDVTEENIQARIRGNILMSLSNKYRAILLSTGNKSELAVGYCTLYGDMSGGLSVISDVPKTLVYKIAKWVNHMNDKPVIPQSVITKEPSAELKPNQKDSDILPTYAVLDEILHRYVELHQSKEEIVASGYKEELIEKVIAMVKRAEFKRRQAPLGIKITDCAFGTGWRMPVAYKSKL
jgi:NAD+ synthetase